MAISEKILKLREKRAKLITDARAIANKRDAEKRDLTGEETEQITRMIGGQDEDGKSVPGEIATIDGEIRTLEAQLKQQERLDSLESEQAATTHDSRRTGPDGSGDGDRGDPDRHRRRANPNEVRYTLRNSGRERVIRLDEGGTQTAEYRQNYNRFLQTGEVRGLREHRDLQADSGIAGGFMVMPQQMSAGVIQGVDDQVLIRQWATVTTVANAASLGMASLDADPADSEWTGELGSPTNDTTMAFGKRELRPYQLMKELRVSAKLLRLANSAESLIVERLGYKFAVAQEKAFMTGNGVNRPLGLFTASADGIPTSRDVVSGAAATFTFDGLIKAKWSIKSAYWGRPGFRFLFHRDCLREIALLKNTHGDYLLRLDASKANQYTIDGTNVEMSEYAPNTFTNLLYGGLVGDFSFYHIVDSMAMSLQRIVDSEAARKNRVHFIGIADTDGMPVLAEAFARIQFST